MATNTTAPGADTGAALAAADWIEALPTGTSDAYAANLARALAIRDLATALDAATDAARALGELEAMLNAVNVDFFPAYNGRVGVAWHRATGCTWKPAYADTFPAAIHAAHAALVAAGELPPLPGDGDSGAAGGGAS